MGKDVKNEERLFNVLPLLTLFLPRGHRVKRKDGDLKFVVHHATACNDKINSRSGHVQANRLPDA